MKRILSVIVAVAGIALVAPDADAKRLGGGGSFGKQRSGISQQQAAPKAPAQQQSQAAPAQQPSGASKWLGPLAGLALGAGLAALFFNNGLGGALAGMLMLGLLAFAAIAAFRYFMRGRTVESRPLQYAGAGPAAPAPVTALPGGAGERSVAATTAAGTLMGRWPAGFDAAGFVRQAKLNFVNLQAANDRRDLSALRDFMTPDLYREIEANLAAAGAPGGRTDVVTLDAEVLDVATEGDLYVVSVRFSGLIREEAGEQPRPFTEIWNLEKPVSGASGWLIAGIQQD